MHKDIAIASIVGRLTRDPEVVQAGQNTKCKFSIASNYIAGSGESRRQEVSYFNIEAWGKLAENIQRYATKGKQVVVSGQLIQRRYTANDGQKRDWFFVKAHEVQFMGSPENGQGSQQYQQSSQYSSDGPDDPGYDDIPF